MNNQAPGEQCQDLICLAASLVAAKNCCHLLSNSFRRISNVVGSVDYFRRLTSEHDLPAQVSF
jgi:hypothetical protein